MAINVTSRRINVLALAVSKSDAPIRMELQGSSIFTDDETSQVFEAPANMSVIVADQEADFIAACNTIVSYMRNKFGTSQPVQDQLSPIDNPNPEDPPFVPPE